MAEPRPSGPSLTRFIERHWLRDSCLSRALLPLAWLHGGVLALRRMSYRRGWFASEPIQVPVLVVGNFFVGGTGKTPLVVALAALLCRSGRVPGIISRGFGGANVEPRPVRPGDHPDQVGDEPLLIAERSNVPVWIGRDRVAAARALLVGHASVDVIICDDGLQHLALRRDIEIAVFDARGAGNGRLLPAGPLRERPRPVDAVVCNGGGTAPGQFAMTIEPAGFYRLGDSASRVDASSLQRLRTIAIAGIGDPQRFFRTLAALHLQPLRAVAFPDHHRFSLADLRFPDCDAIVMTEKDAVKCRALGSPIPLYALRVDARLDASFEAHILTLLQSVSAHGRAST
ncbi:MAG: tetraacyldisaccharide 4'-kinase [Burkholderiales bacterium]